MGTFRKSSQENVSKLKEKRHRALSVGTSQKRSWAAIWGMGTGGGDNRAGEPGSIFLRSDKFLFVPGAFVPSTFIPPGSQGDAEGETMEEPEFYSAGVLGYAYLNDDFPVIRPIPCDTRNQNIDLMGKLRKKNHPQKPGHKGMKSRGRE